MVTFDGTQFHAERRLGLVGDSFDDARVIARLTGESAIGHVRYSTAGATILRNVQPLFAELDTGGFAVAHNGNIVNAPALREELLHRGFGLTATSDTEVIALMLAAAGGRTWVDRLERTVPAWKGAFSLVLLAGDEVIAVRDPWGFRPLSLGRLPHGGWTVASETCALAFCSWIAAE